MQSPTYNEDMPDEDFSEVSIDKKMKLSLADSNDVFTINLTKNANT